MIERPHDANTGVHADLFAIGPLTTPIPAKDVVEDERAVCPLAAIARMTGRYSGRAPAMTALTPTFSTVSSQDSRKAVGSTGTPPCLARGWHP